MERNEYVVGNVACTCQVGRCNYCFCNCDPKKSFYLLFVVILSCVVDENVCKVYIKSQSLEICLPQGLPSVAYGAIYGKVLASEHLKQSTKVCKTEIKSFICPLNQL